MSLEAINQVLASVSPLSWCLGVGMFVFYVLGSTLLQYCYYARETAATMQAALSKNAAFNAKQQKDIDVDSIAAPQKPWKLQPLENTDHLGDHKWWLPLCQSCTRKKRRHKAHCLFATV